MLPPITTIPSKLKKSSASTNKKKIKDIQTISTINNYSGMDPA